MPRLPSTAVAGEGRSGAPRRRMRIVVNPFATTVTERLLTVVASALQARYEADVVATERANHATALAREAVREGLDVVVAFGGDGTVNEVANGLAGSQTALACLPGGATNVFCRMLGLPLDVVDATEHLLHLADDWRVRHLDLGHVAHRAPSGERSDRHFLFSAGVGLDAAVVARVDASPRLKARWRHWWFATAGVQTFARDYIVHPPCIDVEAAGERVRGVTALVQNADPYTFWSGRPLRVAEGATLDGGTLAAAVLSRASAVDVPTVLARLFSSRLEVAAHRRVTAWSGLEALRCTAADGRAVPLQLDGDHIGAALAADFRIAPGALTVAA